MEDTKNYKVSNTGETISDVEIDRLIALVVSNQEHFGNDADLMKVHNMLKQIKADEGKPENNSLFKDFLNKAAIF